VDGVLAFIMASLACVRSNVQMRTEDKKAARSVFSSPSVAAGARGAEQTLPAPSSAHSFARGEDGSTGSCPAQEGLLGGRIHQIQSVHGNNYFFSIFTSGFQNNIACSQTRVTWA